ncbi:MAG: PHP domain-containing protein [Vampirovibrionales bacterium]
MSQPLNPSQHGSIPYVPLHQHSHYSILQASSKVKDLVAVAKEKGFEALALTDNGVMYGALELYQKARNEGLKPIIGCELCVIEGDITDRSSRKTMHNVVLLVKDATGYANLLKLVSMAHLQGFYYKPRINWSLLEAHSEGLICPDRQPERGHCRALYATTRKPHANGWPGWPRCLARICTLS